jgi:hypothetical protein
MLSFSKKFFFPCFPAWATEEFWSPSNDVHVLDGNQSSSVVIRQWGYVKLQPKVFLSSPDIPPIVQWSQKQIQSPKNAWGEGHEMIIITKGG